MTVLKILDGDGAVKYLEGSGAATLSDGFTSEHSVKNTGSQKVLLSKTLDTIGNGTGTANMGVDGSGSPVAFKITPGAGEIYRISRLIFAIRDSGSFDSGGWGSNGGSPLTNGMLFHTTQNSTMTVLEPAVKSHYDLAALCHDISHNSWGSGDEFLTARWTFIKFGQYMRLDGDTGDNFVVTVRDDLTHLVDQVVTIQGYVE